MFGKTDEWYFTDEQLADNVIPDVYFEDNTSIIDLPGAKS